MTQSTSSSDLHTFRVASPLRALIPAVGACLFAFVVVALTVGADENSGVILLILGAVLLFSLALAAWLLTRTRLEVSSDGITYYAIGYRVRSTWPNITGYANRLQGVQSYESLILREPNMELSRWMRLAYIFLPVMEIISAAGGHVVIPERLSRYADNIPVALFSQDWRSDDLGRLVRRYAPQAFDNRID